MLKQPSENPNLTLDTRTGIWINPSADKALNSFALRTYQTSLSRPGETPQMSLARAARAWSGGDMQLAQRLYDYSSKKWFMWATPMIANAPLPGEPFKKMPISCFLTYVDDTTDSLKSHIGEVIDLTVGGGGLGGHWGDIRAADKKSRGTIGHQTVINNLMETWAQSSGRRGSYCTYLPISHPDVLEFINIRLPTQGDPMRKCMSKGYHHAVVITDDFMRAVCEGLDWALVCPHSKRETGVYKARDIWYAILDSRMKQGEPFITFYENVMRWFPKSQIDLGLKFHGSNLCVAPETELLTDEGSFPISTLEGKTVRVWNGEEWSQTTVVKTGTNQPLRTVKLSDGRELTCTEYHKWYTKNHYDKPSVEVRTVDLKVGDTIEPYELPGSDKQGVQTLTVAAIIDTGRCDDTFCVSEPLRHKAVFNGILTGNCNEITLATGPGRTAVCCLSSGNLELVNEWWETRLIEDLITALDNALTCFIEEAPKLSPGFTNSAFSAKQERAIGLGMMGFHALLQRRKVPFESQQARAINRKLFREIRRRADVIDLELAAERGPAPEMVHENRRFSHKLAIAPNATSANGIGTSPGIEPFNANLFVQFTTSGTHVVRNANLECVLDELGKNTDAVWESITVNRGSVQHLDFLSDDEKLVYKTARELDQMWIIQHAADRVPFICQSQSVNLLFEPDADPTYVSNVHIQAWRKGLKGLYYLRGRRPEDAKVSGKIERAMLPDREGVVSSAKTMSWDTAVSEAQASTQSRSLGSLDANLASKYAGVASEESSCVACEG